VDKGKNNALDTHNKIPQEIEESLTAQKIYNEFELKAGVHIGTEERLIIQVIQKGFQEGQKQEREDVLKIVKEYDFIDEDTLKYRLKGLKAGSKDEKE
jgi:hypothetical protein